MELGNRDRVLFALGREQLSNRLDVIDAEAIGCPKGCTYVCHLDLFRVQLIELGFEKIESHGELFVRWNLDQVLRADPEPASDRLIRVMARLGTDSDDSVSEDACSHRARQNAFQANLGTIEIRDCPTDRKDPPWVVGMIVDQIGQRSDRFDFEFVGSLAVSIGAQVRVFEQAGQCADQ